MAYTQQNNAGALFKNDASESRSDSSPHFSGQAKVGEVDYWVNAWVNESRQGNRYLSIKFTPKVSVAETGANDFLDNDIPF